MNIEEYEFSQKGVEAKTRDDGEIDIISDDYCYSNERGCYGCAGINKNDAIAIAKYFNLTSNDITV